MSAEGSLNGTPNEVAYFNGYAFKVEQMLPFIPVWGTDRTYNHFAVPWAFAMDMPYRWVKQIASHLGGTRTGMVMTWPNRIKDAGGMRNQFHHVIDIAPTILDAIGIPQPTMINGIAQRPHDGVNMVYTWDKANAAASSTRKFTVSASRALEARGFLRAALRNPALETCLQRRERPALPTQKASFFGRRQSNNQSQEYFTTCLAMSELSLPTGTRSPLPRQRLCLLFLRF
jgi:arylsulfatase A-like enzyme